jgi:aryl-alcohol dehydrogenase-like predicted oxidoreductase
MRRLLGRTNIEISALGMGCWAIGGPFLADGLPDGWGNVDDKESIRAIQHAIDLGVNFFDTSDAYGAGHSEEVIGQAIKGQRDKVVIATKFGFLLDSQARALTGTDSSVEHLHNALKASLKRLGTDYIDLYQCHLGNIGFEGGAEVWGALEDLKQEGVIRAFGWSTADIESARALAEHTSINSIQHGTHVLHDAREMIAVCEQYSLTSIDNTPLAMGLLTGKFNHDSRLPSDDVRGSKHEWMPFFKDGKPIAELVDQVNAVREILGSGGRSVTQGALAWHWTRSPQCVPIPGFKTVQQVEENVGALRFGPLSPEQMAEIDRILGRSLAQGVGA